MEILQYALHRCLLHLATLIILTTPHHKLPFKASFPYSVPYARSGFVWCQDLWSWRFRAWLHQPRRMTFGCPANPPMDEKSDLCITKLSYRPVSCLAKLLISHFNSPKISTICVLRCNLPAEKHLIGSSGKLFLAPNSQLVYLVAAFGSLSWFPLKTGLSTNQCFHIIFGRHILLKHPRTTWIVPVAPTMSAPQFR